MIYGKCDSDVTPFVSIKYKNLSTQKYDPDNLRFYSGAIFSSQKAIKYLISLGPVFIVDQNIFFFVLAPHNFWWNMYTELEHK